MSIATLKKKIKAIYNNPHIGDKYGNYSKMPAVRMNSYNNKNGNISAGFSLNGTHRSQGYVGQTMLSRHFPQTPMRGNVARGSGGCCGTYNNNIIKPCVNDLNNPNIVKSPVLNTNGFIHEHYKWIWRPQPFTRVKPDNTNNLNTQESYIKHLANKETSCVDLSNNLIQQKPCYRNTIKNNSTKLVCTKSHTANITKPPIINKVNNKIHYRAGLTSSEHINTIVNDCQKYDDFTVPNNRRNMVFACSNPR
jgi:hypothetical protein